MSTVYTIRIDEQLDSYWSEWLEGMALIPLETGGTLLCGPLADQAALYGLLNRIRDLNLKLVSIEKVAEDV